jgi:hypothetical protein
MQMIKAAEAGLTEKEEYWTEVIVRARASSMRIMDFCKKEQIKKNSYYLWFKRLRKDHPEWDEQRTRWQVKRGSRRLEKSEPRSGKRLIPVRVQVTEEKFSGRASPVEVRLRSGHVVVFPATFPDQRLVLFLKKLES